MGEGYIKCHICNTLQIILPLLFAISQGIAKYLFAKKYQYTIFYLCQFVSIAFHPNTTAHLTHFEHTMAQVAAVVAFLLAAVSSCVLQILFSQMGVV
jgi:hypothetical protein